MNITIKSLNTFEFTSDTCIGYTRKGERFLVDLDKFDLIKDYTWYMSSDGYVRTNVSGGSHRQVQLSLHRLIMQCPTGKMVDHVRGKTTRFDNRSCNLRLCTNTENQHNRRATNALNIKGVAYVERRHKYQTQIQVDGKLKYLGMFVDRVEAALTYDRAALQYFWQFACLNNVQGPPRPPVVKVPKSTLESQPKAVTLESHRMKQPHKPRIRPYYVCPSCGGRCTNPNQVCIACHKERYDREFHERHGDINRDSLKQLIRSTPFTTIAKQYGVSDNAIRKWCKKYNLPTKSNEIKRYSDAEWETL